MDATTLALLIADTVALEKLVNLQLAPQFIFVGMRSTSPTMERLVIMGWILAALQFVKFSLGGDV